MQIFERNLRDFDPHITYRYSGDKHTLTVGEGRGTQHWDLSQLNRNQLSGVREMIVDDWCRRNGWPPLYTHDG